MKTFLKKEKFFRVCIMQINYALILSAGLGTRMGEIGKVIPKVLWPIYFKTLLELQIRYCEDLGIQNIYINSHYLHNEIVDFLNESGLGNRVIVLHEEKLLDSGGAIHNLAIRPEVKYQGNLLIVNGDQFMFFEKAIWEKALLKLSACRAVLFGIKVSKDESYSETIIENDCLVAIKKNLEKNRDYITYSGLGLLRLDGLQEAPGASRFFETVANYKEEKIEMITPDDFEYWDFGTSDVYAKNIFKLYPDRGVENKMIHFLKKHEAFFGDLKKFVDRDQRSIDLTKEAEFRIHSIGAKGIFQNI